MRCVEVPAGYDGTVQVTFRSPLVLESGRGCERLSLLGLIAGVTLEKRRERKAS